MLVFECFSKQNKQFLSIRVQCTVRFKGMSVKKLSDKYINDLNWNLKALSLELIRSYLEARYGYPKKHDKVSPK